MPMDAAALWIALATLLPAPAAEAPPDACNRGDASACRSLGEAAFAGRERPRDFRSALAFFAKACDLGDAQSCRRQAEMIFRKQGAAHGAPPLLPLYEKACAGGDLRGCSLLGSALLPSERSPGDPTRALASFEKACAGALLEACTTLGGLYSEGKHLTKDPARSRRYLEAACDGGEAGACALLATIYEKGTDVTADSARAGRLRDRVVELRRRSCAAGDAVDCQRLGANLRSKGTEGAAEAERAFQRACDLGEPYGCRNLSNMYDGTFGGPPRDPDRARALRQQEGTLRANLCAAGDFHECELSNDPKSDYVACDGGDPGGCFRVAKRYLYGEVKDAVRAAHFFARGCDAGDGSHCKEAAEIYATGQSAWSGIRLPPAAGLPDLARGLALYGKGCDLGSAEACLALGARAAEGRGVPRDPARAAALYEQACRVGSGWCRPLADAVRDGAGTARDPARAAELYRASCQTRDDRACHQLGLLYRDGVGVSRDPAKAVELFQAVCRNEAVYAEPKRPGCEEACALSDAASCERAGLAARAARLYEDACARGTATSCQALARMYDRGDLGPKQHEAAARFHGRACDLGSARDCHDLGVAWVSKDARRAVGLYEKACAGGEAEACASAGWLLKNGAQGLAPDPARAEPLLARARELREKAKK